MVEVFFRRVEIPAKLSLALQSYSTICLEDARLNAISRVIRF